MNQKILLTVAVVVGIAIMFILIQNFILTSNGVSGKTISKKPLSGGPYKTTMFAGGCFWSLESYFDKMPNGIVDVVSGYAGGMTYNPTYENYKEGKHREVVEVTYDPKLVSYGELTEYFFRHIDPTDAGGAFFDRGENYTSAIFVADDNERKIAEEIIAVLGKEKIFKKPIVTKVLPTATFWPAEDYHQDYAKNNELHYTSYRIASGRDRFLKITWDNKEGTLYRN